MKERKLLEKLVAPVKDLACMVKRRVDGYNYNVEAERTAIKELLSTPPGEGDPASIRINTNYLANIFMDGKFTWNPENQKWEQVFEETSSAMIGMH